MNFKIFSLPDFEDKLNAKPWPAAQWLEQQPSDLRVWVLDKGISLDAGSIPRHSVRAGVVGDQSMSLPYNDVPLSQSPSSFPSTLKENISLEKISYGED